MNLYHCLYQFHGYTFILVVQSKAKSFHDLPWDVRMHANLILKNPDSKTVQKDRFGLLCDKPITEAQAVEQIQYRKANPLRAGATD